MSWREALHRCQSYGGYLPHWKTSQHMLSENDEVIVNAYAMPVYFEYPEVIFIGMVSKVGSQLYS